MENNVLEKIKEKKYLFRESEEKVANYTLTRQQRSFAPSNYNVIWKN